MKVLGITGGVGSGKSEVLDYLESRYGAYVCQMDEVAKRLEKRGEICFRKIVVTVARSADFCVEGFHSTSSKS